MSSSIWKPIGGIGQIGVPPKDWKVDGGLPPVDGIPPKDWKVVGRLPLEGNGLITGDAAGTLPALCQIGGELVAGCCLPEEGWEPDWEFCGWFVGGVQACGTLLAVGPVGWFDFECDGFWVCFCCDVLLDVFDFDELVGDFCCDEPVDGVFCDELDGFFCDELAEGFFCGEFVVDSVLLPDGFLCCEFVDAFDRGEVVDAFCEDEFFDGVFCDDCEFFDCLLFPFDVPPELHSLSQFCGIRELVMLSNFCNVQCVPHFGKFIM